MTIFSAQDPIANQPYIAINGAMVSNDATSPNNIIDISAGLFRDSTNTFDINLGNWFGEIPAISAGTSIINGFQTPQPPFTPNNVTFINGLVNGALGLDTGTLAASSLYYIHGIFDESGVNAPSALISLSRTAPYLPGLPGNYTNFRWIGQMATNSAIHFLPGYNHGAQNERLFYYDAPQPTAITAGHSTAYANVNLTGLVPAINNIPVWINVVFTAAAAGDTVTFQPGNGTGAGVVITAPVAGATAPVTQNILVMAQLVTIAGIPSPVINYKLTAAGDSVAINVIGYQYSL